MNETELLATLARGEDSRHPFKENFSDVERRRGQATGDRSPNRPEQRRYRTVPKSSGDMGRTAYHSRPNHS
jgi:hypothetical protein